MNNEIEKKVENNKIELFQMRIKNDKKEKIKKYCQKRNITITELITEFIDKILESENKQKQMRMEF